MNGRACRRYIFRSYNTSTLNATHFDEKPFDASAKQETKRLRGFEIRICISWSFSSDFVAVKGLNYSFESFLLFCVFVLLVFDKDFCCLFLVSRYIPRGGCYGCYSSSSVVVS